MKTLLIITLYIAFALFTYAPDYGWWISLFGSAIILFVGKFAFGSEWRSKLGLAATTREIAIATTSFGILGIAFAVFFFHQLELSQLTFFWWWERKAPLYHLHTFAQVFNEEIALGGIPLLWLTRSLAANNSQQPLKNQSLKLIATISAIAIIFSLLHFALYAWSPFVPKSTVELSTLSLLSLCCVGIIRNLLIVWRGHIVFAFALHFAWNSVFFGGMVTRESTQVNETELFNLTLGNSTFATLLVAITIVLIFGIHKETLVGKTEIQR